MDLATLQALNAARSVRKAAVLLTDTGDGRSQVVVEGDMPVGPFADPAWSDAIAQALRSGKSGLIAAQGREVFVNVHLPPPRIVVIGAVHITQALAGLAGICGYDLTIVDPRTAFATPERFAGTRLVAEWPQDVPDALALDPYTALAAVTHDPKIDDFALAEALRKNCFYVGALGSRKTHAKRLQRLQESGLAADSTDRIAAPIGLDIGASSPAEIALAIMAQIVQAFRRRDVASPAAAAGAGDAVTGDPGTGDPLPGDRL